ncbi:tRNA uridine-5-carboxymethylaminomethyl(34) synthesis GTPase MnmE [Methyloceanibacter sp.]|uniref:tRNA uridine-5-carboxymethylaminomethyl(34) synthesis GTPase MnmE n=1 Tax=Methyloceanibacter sp. TaxID=1965321 RepID=UPI002BCD7F4E|nr:tRNA uridine-5-carboxymethylaminomethyl(34) synthesis GTPase MnmE [Methyloceanibacter sp.]HML91590.1 tRNA uridine-5-carboxymethylaminomethyl(34) synthesis GTPase MnmE [Methyloceanibacter sp.]
MNHTLPDHETVEGARAPCDTIVALASGAGVSAVAVVRVSGPATDAVLRHLIDSLPVAREASLRRIGGIDRGLVLWFPGPASFTGEDMAELQVHGGRAVVRAVVDAVLVVEGTRLAEPGEFARRAFENGKLDLTEVEGLADLVAAETEGQRRQALAQAEGGLRRLYEGWRAGLLKAQSLMEAALDFSDEADVAGEAVEMAGAVVAPVLVDIEAHLADRSGERLREGFRVVIAGPPNAGKSSILNALAKRDVAIVSEEAGTTRDVIEVHLDIGVVPVILADTAGLREGGGAIETEGMRRAVSRAGAADLVLWVIDGTDPVFNPPEALTAASVLRVVNKADLLDVSGASLEDRAALLLSAKSGKGLGDLIDELERRAGGVDVEFGQSPITRTRHRTELVSARDALKRFVNHDLDPELRAEELRLAARHLGRLTGRIDVEEVLGAIFSEFCIGK